MSADFRNSREACGGMNSKIYLHLSPGPYKPKFESYTYLDDFIVACPGHLHAKVLSCFKFGPEHELYA